MHPPTHPARIDTDPPIPFTDEEIGSVRWTQCQAQLLGQFSVWVPPVTLMKRLTLGRKARAGYSDPGRGRCTPPAPKKAIDTARDPTPDTDRRDGGSRGPDAAARCYRT